VDNLVPFDGHPYKVLDDDSMNDLTESVLDNGIMEPIIVRPLENTDNYEIISGHRRYHAAKKAGLTEVPAFIRAVSRDEAAIMLVDSNLHRERILPSEKAFAYKLKAEALNHQGKRSDLTLEQIAPKLSTEIIAEQVGTSKDVIKRYIRLTNLIPELLDMMDEGKIAFSVGVELSFLDDQLQYDVLNACEENDNTPSYAQAVRMHKAHTVGDLDREEIDAIMCEEKANQREKVTIPLDRLKGKIPGSYSVQQQQDYIVKAVDHYHRFLQRQRDAR
ncbi:MAG: ParB/RepB/Spo0J family partition protein, partial [Clostridia bacterium]|nr:ParB/RepB/Spo0J family partition protein [Clostridia bacterium]